MKGDPSNPADWLKIALADLARARKTVAEGDLPAATLWLEQAAEKAAKG
jgi:HEPN domain-containing protein